MKGEKIPVQLIGRHITTRLNPKFNPCIKVTHSLYWGSPFALSGHASSEILNLFPEEKEERILFELKKNLKNFLSRDENVYERNQSLQKVATEVYHKNVNEYIIIENSAAALPVVKADGCVYTRTDEMKPFIKKMRECGKKVIDIDPVTECDFNWKYYFDFFIDAVQSAYDNKHIILLRTASHRCYFENEVGFFDEKASAYRKFMDEVDGYFEARTHCITLDALECSIPSQKRKMYFPFCMSDDTGLRQIEMELSDAILNHSVNSNRIGNIGINVENPLVSNWEKRLQKPVFDAVNELVREVEECWIVKPEGIPEDLKKRWEKFFAMLDYIGEDSLADYFAEEYNRNEWEDKEKLTQYAQIYTANFRCSQSDVVAICGFYEKGANKDAFGKIVRNIIADEGSLNVMAQKRHRLKNIRFLLEYPYVQKEVLEHLKDVKKLYVRMNENVYFCLESDGKQPIKRIIIPWGNVNVEEVVEQGSCRFWEAEELTGNFRLCAQPRAINQMGENPI